MVSEKGLEGNHHGIAEIAIMIVFLHILGEYVTRVDDSRHMFRIDIFELMAFTNNVFPEVEVLDTFLCH